MAARQLRKTMTPHELRLWAQLRRMKPQGHHFRRQVPIEGYIVDFACFGSRLIIEVDGGQHGDPAHRERDETRDGHLRGEGFRVLRFWNSQLNENFEGVVAAIIAAL
jgi:very-short-patch-repair endonuclease